MVQRNRNTFGVITVPMDKIARKLIDYSRRNEPVLSLFLGDQSPQFHKIQYWTNFMGRPTPLFLGTEKLARKLDAAVVFCKIRKIRRGKYQVDLELICENPSSLDSYKITEAHVRILENLIREAPENWLWSHNRWGSPDQQTDQQSNPPVL